MEPCRTVCAAPDHPIALAASRNLGTQSPPSSTKPGGPIDAEICARILLAQKAPETFVGANDLALV